MHPQGALAAHCQIPAHRQGNAGTPENKEGENSHSHLLILTALKDSEPPRAAEGEELCHKPGTNPWCDDGFTADQADHLQCQWALQGLGPFPAEEDAADSLGTGALQGTSLGALLIGLWAFFSPPNFRQC